ncbi:hypothetical protein QQG55_18600 [Brugia pahangi]
MKHPLAHLPIIHCFTHQAIHLLATTHSPIYGAPSSPLRSDYSPTHPSTTHLPINHHSFIHGALTRPPIDRPPGDSLVDHSLVHP